MPNTIACVCRNPNCPRGGLPFEINKWDFNRGRGKYCSQACTKAHMKGHRPYNVIEPEIKTCPVCGKQFETGGRGRPPRSQICCSVECQKESRFRSGGVCHKLSIEEAAYLAGFMDGEGSVMLVTRNTGVAVKISATNSNREVLAWIVEVTGIGTVLHARGAGERTAETWQWQANADGAVSVLEKIRPYMKIKHEQAGLAIETRERLKDRVLKADRVWQMEWRDRMKFLNRRGPRSEKESEE